MRRKNLILQFRNSVRSFQKRKFQNIATNEILIPIVSLYLYIIKYKYITQHGIIRNNTKQKQQLRIE